MDIKEQNIETSSQNSPDAKADRPKTMQGIPNCHTVSNLGKLLTDRDVEVDDEAKPLSKTKGFDAKTLEFWLNQTLMEAQLLNIRGTLKKNIRAINGRANICIDYGIDRLTLKNTGLTNFDIDKLYRMMFVNTSGFFR